MQAATIGQTVRVHYTGTLEDGSTFDSSKDRAPLEFTVGGGEVIGGFDQAVAGMAPGDTKKVTVAAADAYGPHRPELVQDMPRDAIPPEVDLTPGNRLAAKDQAGNELVLTVVEADDETAKLDANHPLAGEDLTFEIELVEVL
jgi:peptidylprolyl isomerase